MESREFRLYGPPGTGKTTWIAKKATEYAERFGSDQVSICSLTTSAVGEAMGRGIPIEKENISTLHARCKRALSAPAPAESMVKSFVEQYPQWSTTIGVTPCLPKSMGMDSSEVMMSGGGASLYEQAQILRQKLIPLEDWPESVRSWYAVWSAWCDDIGHLDFTGWLEEAIRVKPLPPQQVIFVDEAQDHTPLQLAVIRSWDARIRILVGDDDQNLYEWSGAVPREFFSNEICEADGEMVLDQSFRVPRAIHEMAMRWTDRIFDRREKQYLPKDEEGSIVHVPWRLDNVEFGEELPPYLLENEDETYMILASCSYMLTGLMSLLKKKRIPFHNPYRPGDSRWNPLDSPKKISSVFMISDRFWTGGEAEIWASTLKAGGVFKKGKKTEFIDFCTDHPKELLDENILSKYFLEETLERILARDLGVLRELRRVGVPGSWDYALDIFEEYGCDVEPRLIIGTIHSVKGGEADNVYLIPDLSPSGFMEYTGSKSDRVYRLFYVGITRARKNLYLCQQNQPRAVVWI